ncbi:MAG: pilus assembly protein PilM [Chloroflexota bacterium]
MAKKLTVFVEDTNVRLLLSNGRFVEKWANILLDPDIVSGGVVRNEEKLASLIQEHLNLLRIRTKGVILGLSGFNSLYRIISIPDLPDTMLPEAIRHEAERVMPVSLDEVYLSYQPIPGVTSERRIFLAAFPKNSTDSLIRTIRKAGLQPTVMDLAPLAVNHTVDLPRAIVVNVRGIQMDITVIVDMVPQVIRSLQLPGETESLTERLAAVAEEIERTVAFYNTSQPEKPLDDAVPLLVCGDLAEFEDSLSLLSSRLGLQTSVLMSPLESPAGFDSFRFMVNIGLAIKKQSNGKGKADSLLVDFNALPEIYLVKQVSIINIVAPVVIIVIMSLIVLMAYMVLGVSAQTTALNFQKTTIQGYTKSLQSEITVIANNINQREEEIKPWIAKAGALEDRLDAIKVTHTRFDENPRELVGFMPPTVNLTLLSYASDSITITGTGSDLEDIYRYARRIRETSKYLITITSLERVEQVAEETDEETSEVIVSYSFDFSLQVR